MTYQHYSGVHETVDERGEVAMLTRNIVVQGDVGSNATRFGGHIMVLKDGHAVLQGVEVQRCGQFGVIGRYPIHFHCVGDAQGSAVLDCSIHHNFQRALTVHCILCSSFCSPVSRLHSNESTHN